MKEEQQKYKVNFKKSADKKVDAQKHKNFDQVYEQYTHWIYRHPWSRFQFHKSKNRKIALYILLIGIVAALVIAEYVKEGQ